LNQRHLHNHHFNQWFVHEVLNCFVHHICRNVNDFHQSYLNPIRDWHELKRNDNNCHSGIMIDETEWRSEDEHRECSKWETVICLTERSLRNRQCETSIRPQIAISSENADYGSLDHQQGLLEKWRWRRAYQFRSMIWRWYHSWKIDHRGTSFP
jgi:hypothetical protein